LYSDGTIGLLVFKPEGTIARVTDLDLGKSLTVVDIRSSAKNLPGVPGSSWPISTTTELSTLFSRDLREGGSGSGTNHAAIEQFPFRPDFTFFDVLITTPTADSTWSAFLGAVVQYWRWAAAARLTTGK